MEALLFILSALAIIALLFMIKIVPQQQAWVLERLGKFDRVLQPGLNILIPIIERVAYKHTLKEQAMDVHAQTAISNDNVTLQIDGVLYVKIIDATAASYGVDNPYYAISQLALAPASSTAAIAAFTPSVAAPSVQRRLYSHHHNYAP